MIITGLQEWNMTINKTKKTKIRIILKRNRKSKTIPAAKIIKVKINMKV